MKTKRTQRGGDALYKAFIYVALITFVITILVPVSWAFLASVKEDSSFTATPGPCRRVSISKFHRRLQQRPIWAPYFFNSVLVTALALALLLVVALPASYVLSRFKFRGRRVLSVAFMGGLFINVNYIVVPIFLMLVDGNKGLASLMESLRVEEGSPVYNLFGNGFFPQQPLYSGAGLRVHRPALYHLPALQLLPDPAQRILKKRPMWTAAAISTPW